MKGYPSAGRAPYEDSAVAEASAAASPLQESPSSPRKDGLAYKPPYTFVWICTSFAARSARCRISGMSGSSPFDVAGGDAAATAGVASELDDDDAAAFSHFVASHDGDDGGGRTMASTASSTHSRIRRFISALSGDPARRLLSAQLFDRSSVPLSGAAFAFSAAVTASFPLPVDDDRGSAARIVTCSTTSPMSVRHLRNSVSRSRSCRLDVLLLLLLPLLLPLALEDPLDPLERGRCCMKHKPGCAGPISQISFLRRTSSSGDTAADAAGCAWRWRCECTSWRYSMSSMYSAVKSAASVLSVVSRP